MGFQLPGIVNAKRSLIRSLSSSSWTAESKTLDIHEAILQSMLERARRSVKLKKNLDMIIPWVVSQSPAVKTLSFISLPA
ncbi:unnamed protein product [Prunus armeniaca]